jgi:hypothetical protein
MEDQNKRCILERYPGEPEYTPQVGAFSGIFGVMNLLQCEEPCEIVFKTEQLEENKSAVPAGRLIAGVNDLKHIANMMKRRHAA